MATTTKLKDFLGRWLTNAIPGTSDATDHLGRAVIAADKDFIGRLLTFDNPALWAVATAYAVGDHVRLTGGELLRATVAGTSDATTEPTPPAVGDTVVDATVTWVRVL